MHNRFPWAPAVIAEAIPDSLARGMGGRPSPDDHVLVEAMLPMGIKLRDLVIEQAKALGYRNPEALYTTSDFGSSLAESVQHVALQSRAAGIELLKICKQLPLKDFRDSTFPQIDIKDVGDDVTNEHGAPLVVQITDNEGLTAHISRRERFFGISTPVIVNDSVGLLQMFSSGLGGMAQRNETHAVASLLASNPILPDARALFNAVDGNLRASGASVTPDLLGEGFTYLRRQKTSSGNDANNKARFLVVAPEQETAALEAVRAITIDPQAPRLEVLTHPD